MKKPFFSDLDRDEALAEMTREAAHDGTADESSHFPSCTRLHVAEVLADPKLLEQAGRALAEEDLGCCPPRRLAEVVFRSVLPGGA